MIIHSSSGIMWLWKKYRPTCCWNGCSSINMTGAIYYQKLGEVFTAACGSISHSWARGGETHAPLLQLGSLPVGVSFPWGQTSEQDYHHNGRENAREGGQTLLLCPHDESASCLHASLMSHRLWTISIQFDLYCIALLTIDAVIKQQYRNPDVDFDPYWTSQRGQLQGKHPETTWGRNLKRNQTQSPLLALDF